MKIVLCSSLAYYSQYICSFAAPVSTQRNKIEVSLNPFSSSKTQYKCNTMPLPTSIHSQLAMTKSCVKRSFSDASIHQISPTTTKDQVFMRTAESPTNTAQEEELGAALLLSVAAIVTKEISVDGVNWEDDLENFPMLPCIDHDPTYEERAKLSPRCTESSVPSSVFSNWNRIRAVSIDIPEDLATYRGEKKAPTEAIVSPVTSPALSRRFPLRKAVMLRKQSIIKQESPRNHKRTLLPPKTASPSHALKTILRKKFSWKNFPEVCIFRSHSRKCK